MFEKIAVIWSGHWQMYLGQGLTITLGLSAMTVLFGTVIGALIALLKMSKIPPLRWLATIYIEVIRGTPMLLQLMLFSFVLPSGFIMGGFGWIYKIVLIFNPDYADYAFIKFMSVSVALILNSSAYVSEIIRSGIQAVDRGQTEAARSLGLNGTQTMTRIVIPQAIRNILPALGNEFVMVIKETSLASTFFIGDIMTVYNVVRGKTYLVIEPLLIAAAIYFVVCFILSKLISVWERRLNRGER